VKEDCAVAAREKKSARKMKERVRRRECIKYLREEMEDSAAGRLRQWEGRKERRLTQRMRRAQRGEELKPEDAARGMGGC